MSETLSTMPANTDIRPRYADIAIAGGKPCQNDLSIQSRVIRAEMREEMAKRNVNCG